MFKPVIFREYDIRGVYKEQFDEDFAYLLGRAHVAYVSQELKVKNPVLTVGYDARLSSPSLAKAIVRGMVESGASVLELGLITTPISYYSTFALPNVNGAIMITGSHNPPEYNGFKISVGKGTIYGEKIKDLQRIIDSNKFISGSGSSKSYDIFPEYIERYKKEFGSLAGVKVVADCGNGAAGSVLRRLFDAVNISAEILFEEPDGNFPNHHPDPTVEENVHELQQTVVNTKADIGVGFDGDADRVGVVDENGKLLLGDELMTIVSRDLLSKSAGAKIIGDVKCSDRLYADIASRGGTPIMWKTGHSLIKQKIKEESAPFGGELSGHIFFADRNYGYDDSLYAALRVIEILAKTKKPLSRHLDGFPMAYNTPEIRIDTTEEKKVSIVSALREKYAKPSQDYKTNLIDGIRISYPDGWALARASNTQPVLVLRFESSTEAGLKRIQSEIEALVKPLL